MKRNVCVCVSPCVFVNFIQNDQFDVWNDDEVQYSVAIFMGVCE